MKIYQDVPQSGNRSAQQDSPLEGWRPLKCDRENKHICFAQLVWNAFIYFIPALGELRMCRVFFVIISIFLLENAEREAAGWIQVQVPSAERPCQLVPACFIFLLAYRHYGNLSSSIKSLCKNKFTCSSTGVLFNDTTNLFLFLISLIKITSNCFPQIRFGKHCFFIYVLQPWVDRSCMRRWQTHLCSSICRVHRQ